MVMVDYKEIKNVKGLKADDVTKEEEYLLSFQNVNHSVRIKSEDVSNLDIKYQMDHTFVFPQPEGKPYKLAGYISPENVRDWYLIRSEQTSKLDELKASSDKE